MTSSPARMTDLWSTRPSVGEATVTALITLCKPVTMADNWSNKEEDGHAGHRRSGSSLRSKSSRPAVRQSLARTHAATGEEMVAAMNSVGVDGAIMVSSFSAYEYDPSYALEVYNTYPDKFRVVTPVDATDPAIDDVVAKWAATRGARGIRIRMRDGLPMDADHPGLNRAFAAAAKHGLPVNLLCWGILDKGLPHIQRHRDTDIVIDHLGLYSLLARRSPPTFGPIFQLLALAQYENVRVKISGACTMSHQPFPYDDIWEPVLRVIDAFGLDRCMWGTDWTRTIGMLTYEEGVAPFRDTKRLSENDKAALMGGTLQKVYKW